ncbi:MAG TPA: FKBP-type peptidyl-prolyl cis-trans isomerase [Gemmatimonadales bacterium]|nr:FKBP-type peptidyl-prolyl cis-trans isomerase [Gemmatimonadales bacterium]
MRLLVPRSLAIASALSLGLAACSDNSTVPTIETTTFAPSLGVDLAASVKAPSGLYYRDMTVGTGATVSNGQQLSMRYTGWLATGSQFDSNVNGSPFSFHLGAGEVIDGWDLGVAGMKVGGRRQLVIPPALGYGSRGSGPIPGNAVLVFIVDVLSAQ